MAKLDTTEIDAINDFLSQFGTSWTNVAKAGLFEGARVFKDALIAEIDELPSISDRYYWGRMIPMPALRDSEKEGLKNGVRIHKFEQTPNGVSVGISFAGYNANGDANIMIARSLERGTSVNRPSKFVKRAFNKSNQKRIKRVVDKIYSIKLKD